MYIVYIVYIMCTMYIMCAMYILCTLCKLCILCISVCVGCVCVCAIIHIYITLHIMKCMCCIVLCIHQEHSSHLQWGTACHHQLGASALDHPKMGSRSRCSRTWRLPQLVKTRPLVRQAPLPAWLNTSTMLQVIATTNPGSGFFFRNIWSTFIKTLYTLSCWNMAVREISGWRSGRDWLSPRSPSCPSCPS